MTPERWQKVQDVLNRALEVPRSDRKAFLSGACGPDTGLRAEVESLLKGADSADEFLAVPVYSLSGLAEEATTADLTPGNPAVEIEPGTRIVTYIVREKIGEGGMGVVYRALDTELNREIALKFLNARAAGNSEIRERFKREARAASAINHPSVCTVYGVGEYGGQPYLAMELLEGEPLRSRLARGPMPIAELLASATGLAEALAAAHHAGVVHRDIKPGNLFLTHSGLAKVLDFGLARTAEPNAKDAEQLTESGRALGTIAYMSPEQARGEKLDARTDLFSFGAVLYEMATGKQAFPGETAALIFSAILNQAPIPPRSLRGEIPVALENTILKLLEKDRDFRYQTASDLVADLRRARRGDTVTRTLLQGPALPRRNFWLVPLAVGVAGIGGLISWSTQSFPIDVSSYRYTALSRSEAPEYISQWSPDGKTIAYSANIRGVGQIFTRPADGMGSATQLTHSTPNTSWPFWSRDGGTIYYHDGDRRLWAIGALGGTPRLILEDVVRADLNTDGKTMAVVRNSDRSKLWFGTLGGKDWQDRSGLFPPKSTFETLHFSPDGMKLVIAVDTDGRERQLGWWVLPLNGGPPRKVADAKAFFYGASWFPDSRRIAHARREDADRFTVVVTDTETGKERTILAGIQYFLYPTVSPDGTRLALSTGDVSWHVLEVPTAAGNVETLIGRSGTSWWPSWAPGGTHYIFATHTDGPPRVDDYFPKERITRTLLSSQSLPKVPLIMMQSPRLSPDGERFVFAGQQANGKYHIWTSNVGGTRTLDLDPVAVDADEPSWSPDGEWVVYRRWGTDGIPMVAKVLAAGGSPPIILGRLIGKNVVHHQWSPRGNVIAYEPPGGGIVLVSPEGKDPRVLSKRNFSTWGFSPGGDRIFAVFRDAGLPEGEWQLYTIQVDTGAEKLVGGLNFPPTVNGIAGFSMHPDGTRFLTSAVHWPYDIWMLEGFDQEKSPLDRLRGR